MPHSVDKNPIFIASQRLRRLDVNAAQRKRIREFLKGQAKSFAPPEEPSGDDVQEPLDATGRGNDLWRVVEDRAVYLAEQKRLCLTVDGGIGKSTALRQAQVLRQAEREADHHRTRRHMTIIVQLSQLPKNWRRILDLFKKSNEAPLLVREARDLFSRRNGSLANVPTATECQGWLRAMIRSGSFTLMVDAIDEVGRKAAAKKTAALRQFLEAYPNVACVVAARPYVIDDYWHLFSNGHDATDEGSEWEFALVDPFTPAEVEQYLGSERYTVLKKVDANSLFVPRTIDLIRTMTDDEVAKIRTSADVYWYSIDRTLGKDVDKHRKAGKTNLTNDEILDLFSAMAFVCVRWKNGPVRQISRGQFRTFQGRFASKAQEVFPNWSEKTAKNELKRLATLNSQVIDFAFLGSLDIKDLRWRNTTLRDFLAALWVARSSSKRDRRWLGKRTPVRSASSGEIFNESCRNLPFYDVWRFVCEMPTDALTGSDDQTASHRIVDAWKKLFVRRNECRPNEMIYRCWPRLLQHAGWLKDWNGGEDQLAAATLSAQREAWSLCETRTAKSSNTDVKARRLVLDWLTGHPLQVFAESPDPVACRFEESFQTIPADVSQPLSFWYGSEKTERSIGSQFQLSAFQITNQLVRRYDAYHGAMDHEYEQFSPYEQGAAICLNWYDAWCVSTWLHGRLPSEVEWEYACRDRPGATAKVPQSHWHFGDDETQFEEYGWYNENSGTPEDAQNRQVHAHSVGQKFANPFQLYDIHGNVWEWCADWYATDAMSRVLRGGSFGNSAFNSGCSYRIGGKPCEANNLNGCRVARAEPRKY